MKVLCVDDDLMNRQVVQSMLAVAGASTVDAADAETGLALAKAENFDMVLMDLRMPGMDGLTALRQLRSRPAAGAGVPVIMVTAETGPHLRRECLAAGADDVLQKPIAMTKLLKSISEIMLRRNANVFA